MSDDNIHELIFWHKHSIAHANILQGRAKHHRAEQFIWHPYSNRLLRNYRTFVRRVTLSVTPLMYFDWSSGINRIELCNILVYENMCHNRVDISLTLHAIDRRRAIIFHWSVWCALSITLSSSKADMWRWEHQTWFLYKRTTHI